MKDVIDQLGVAEGSADHSDAALSGFPTFSTVPSEVYLSLCGSIPPPPNWTGHRTLPWMLPETSLSRTSPMTVFAK